MSDQFCIYRVTNLINGKTYIGQHHLRKGSLEADDYWGSGIALRAAIRKYGDRRKNFKREILEIFQTAKEVSDAEIAYIRKERALGHAEYNLAKGGEGGDNSEFIDYEKAKRNLTKEQRERWSKQTKGKHWYNNGEKTVFAFECPEGFVKGRLNCHWNENKVYSEESRKKISESRKRFYANISEEKKQELNEKVREGVRKALKERPEDFVEKRKLARKIYSESFRIGYEKRNEKIKGRHWYTNGKNNLMTFECPLGYHPGKTISKDS